MDATTIGRVLECVVRAGSCSLPEAFVSSATDAGLLSSTLETHRGPVAAHWAAARMHCVEDHLSSTNQFRQGSVSPACALPVPAHHHDAMTSTSL